MAVFERLLEVSESWSRPARFVYCKISMTLKQCVIKDTGHVVCQVPCGEGELENRTSKQLASHVSSAGSFYVNFYTCLDRSELLQVVRTPKHDKSPES